MTRSFLLATGVLLPASLLAILIALAYGSVAIAPGDLLAVIQGEGSRLHNTLVLELRLPRALAAFAPAGCWASPVP